MSVRAINWAFEQEVPPPLKVILLALADWADGDGVAFPGQKSLAAKTSIPERTLRRHLQELEERGLIQRRRRSLDNGGRTSDEYRLIALPAKLAGGATGQIEGGNRPTVAATGEPSVEPSVTATARARQMPDGLTWTNAHALKATAKGVDVEVEFQKFTDYHLAKGSKFVDWDRAFHTWLNNCRPDPGLIGRTPAGPSARPARPSRDDEIRDFMSRSIGLDQQGALEA